MQPPQSHAGFDFAGGRLHHSSSEVWSTNRRLPLALCRCRHANPHFFFFIIPYWFIFFHVHFFFIHHLSDVSTSRPAGQIQPTASCYSSGGSLKDVIKKRMFMLRVTPNTTSAVIHVDLKSLRSLTAQTYQKLKWKNLSLMTNVCVFSQ